MVSSIWQVLFFLVFLVCGYRSPSDVELPFHQSLHKSGRSIIIHVSSHNGSDVTFIISIQSRSYFRRWSWSFLMRNLFRCLSFSSESLSSSDLSFLESSKRSITSGPSSLKAHHQSYLHYHHLYH